MYVDALGTTTTYEAYLSSLFPGINFTVTTKADSKFKIVGAASVAAKVTRDACIEEWKFEENRVSPDAGPATVPTWSSELGSGYPSGLIYLEVRELGLKNISQIQKRRLGYRLQLSLHLVSRPLSGSLGQQSRFSWRKVLTM